MDDNVDENGRRLKGKSQNDFTEDDRMREKDDNLRNGVFYHYSVHDTFENNKRNLSANESKPETGEGDDNARKDEKWRRDDNFPQRGDIIITDDKFDQNEKKLYERENNSEPREEVDDAQNNFTETDDDRRIAKNLPKREDEILKDDKFRLNGNEFCDKGSNSETGEGSESSDGFAEKNEEGSESNLPENEDNEVRDDKNCQNEKMDERGSRYQNGEEADDAQNIFTETDEDIRLCTIFSESTDDDFDDKEDALIPGDSNLRTQRETYYRQDNFPGSDKGNCDKLERKYNKILQDDDFIQKQINSVKFTVEKEVLDKRLNKMISKQSKTKSPHKKIRKSVRQESTEQKQIDPHLAESLTQFQPVTYDLQIEWDLCTTVSAFLRVVGYVGDLVSDLVVCYFWFRNGHPLWFVLSLFFTLFPTIILNWISYFDMSSQRIMKNLVLRNEQKPWIWKITVASHFLLLGPFIRYLNNFLLMIRFRNKAIKFKNINAEDKILYEIMLRMDDSRIFVMTFTEAFIESAPQLILQIYTMSLITDNTVNKTRVIAQVASMFFSLFMLSWSATKFHHTKKMLSERNIFGCIFNFLWYVCSIASRMLSVALFATIFPIACLTISCCHIVGVSSWILYRRYVGKKYQVLPMFKIKYTGNVLYIMFIGVIYMFCYCELGTVRTRCRLLIYYLVIGVENVVFINLWFEYVQNPHHWLNTLVFVAVFVCFVLGIVCMMIYYRFFHVNILKHPERWKMKILFPEKQEGDERKEEEDDPERSKMKILFQGMKLDDEKEDEEDQIKSYVMVDSPPVY